MAEARQCYQSERSTEVKNASLGIRMIFCEMTFVESESKGENNTPTSFLLTFNILPVILGDKSSWYPIQLNLSVQPQRGRSIELHLKRAIGKNSLGIISCK